MSPVFTPALFPSCQSPSACKEPGVDSVVCKASLHILQPPPARPGPQEKPLGGFATCRGVPVRTAAEKADGLSDRVAGTWKDYPYLADGRQPGPGQSIPRGHVNAGTRGRRRPTKLVSKTSPANRSRSTWRAADPPVRGRSRVGWPSVSPHARSPVAGRVLTARLRANGKG